MNEKYMAIGIFSVIGILVVLGLIAYGNWKARKAGIDQGRKEVVKGKIKARDARSKEVEENGRDIESMNGNELHNKALEQWRKMQQ